MSGHENSALWAKRHYDVDDIYNRVPDNLSGHTQKRVCTSVPADEQLSWREGHLLLLRGRWGKVEKAL